MFDICDVWLESGSSWNTVLRKRGVGFPTDLYLEGSDQHRGWFQLSLLPLLGATGEPPFRTLLTHGFMVDKDGKKMGKSARQKRSLNVETLLKNYGADVLRWWVCSLAFENDIKVDLHLLRRRRRGLPQGAKYLAVPAQQPLRPRRNRLPPRIIRRPRSTPGSSAGRPSCGKRCAKRISATSTAPPTC